MNAIHRMHVCSRKPLHGLVEFGHDVVVIQKVPRHGRCSGWNLFTGYFVTAAIDGVEERFREIYARAEKLHLLAKTHCRNAARDAVIVSPERPHEIVIFIL